ncbi:hypothetical protein [Sphingomonas paucimobilis]|uniref:Uncharacterized protein n=1 Tax=Sphingomonas paucimobilis TaxID=13689 RepID=A0A7Y2KTB7_SPHPI|nr:hypothetical protein [Sphingomonas paucimobilis]NNG59777.1 hypothetical protein [Sphingomonas paucimobilis]
MSAPMFAAVQGAVAPLLGFQALLQRCRTAADRKRLVMAAWECGALDRQETDLLVTANQLETA